MGARGPAPKPTALKVLAGNPGKRQLNDREPKPDARLPRCPSWLEAEAKREWKRICDGMPTGVLTSVDRGALAQYCQAWSDFVAASKLLKTVDDHCQVTANGNAQLHPRSLVLRSSSERLIRLGGLLGLNPSARSRIRMEAEEQKNPLEEFLQRKKDVG